MQSKLLHPTTGLAVLYERSYDGVRVGTGLHSIVKRREDDGRLQIECDNLDTIISNHRADVMKIDIEGAEILALEGATKVLKQLRKVIVEIHDRNLVRVKEIPESNNFILEIMLQEQSKDCSVHQKRKT